MFAAREVAKGGAGHATQPDQLQQFVRRHRVRVVPRKEVEDAAWTQHRIDAATLEHDTDAAGERGMVSLRVETEHPDVPPDGRR